eukprot:7701859-Pyramimonas_sp.AAC.1
MCKSFTDRARSVFQSVALASAPRRVSKRAQGLHELKAACFPKCGSRLGAAHMCLNSCKTFTTSHGSRTRHDKCCSGAVQDRQNATISLTRGAEVPKTGPMKRELGGR